MPEILLVLEDLGMDTCFYQSLFIEEVSPPFTVEVLLRLKLISTVASLTAV